MRRGGRSLRSGSAICSEADLLSLELELELVLFVTLGALPIGV